MKRISTLVALLLVAGVAMAQTLVLQRGNVSVLYDVQQMGEVQVSDDAATLSIAGTTYDISTIDQMLVTNQEVKPLTIDVAYTNQGATVCMSGDVAPYLTVDVAGGDVSITADALLQQEVTYSLTGSSTSASFTMEGEFKARVVLNDVSLTSTTLNMPAINILNGKRIDIEINGQNSFADVAGGSHKGAFFVNGHAEITGDGTLQIKGNSKHAYVSDEYTQIKPEFTGSIDVVGAVNDAFHIDQYLLMQGGKLTMKNVGGDGIDVSLTNDAADEWNGQVFIEGGIIELDVVADDTKGIKCDADMTISGGTIMGTVSGNGTKGLSIDGNLLINQATGTTLIDLLVTGTTYAPGTVEESKCRGIKGKKDFTFDGGKILISATGVKSKAISIDGNYYYKSGSLNCAVDAAN
ncbi:MAG: carbohydrate-binding domain-containing protein [Bacteroidaceae bacterium]|nr:carbohydrate-binding domain-containing protein [Bacteroidaceae bacterium]